jgi:hypothetical protein
MLRAMSNEEYRIIPMVVVVVLIGTVTVYTEQIVTGTNGVI